MRVNKIFHGWINIAVIWFVYCVTLTPITYSFGIISPGMAEYFGTGLTPITAGFTAYLLCSALLSPIVGRIISKLGSKNTMLLGCAVLLCGSLLMAFVVKGLFLYYFVWTIMVSFGVRSAALMAPQSLLTKWFFSKRSFAMSLILTAGGVGGYIFTPIMRSICAQHSWRGVWVFFALCATTCILFTLVFIREEPSSIGQLIDNGHVLNSDKKSSYGAYKSRDPWTLKDALRQPAFYVLTVISIAAAYLMNVVSNTAIPYLSTAGLNPDTVAEAVGLFALVNVIARLLVGYMIDHISYNIIITIGGAMGALGCGLILFPVTAVSTSIGLVMAGIGYAVTFVTPQTLLVDFFGVQHYAEINGFYSMLTSGLSSVNPLLIGLIFDFSGNYSPCWYLGIILFMIVFVLSLLMTAPKYLIKN